MTTKKELFVNSVKLIDIDGKTNIPTVLLLCHQRRFEQHLNDNEIAAVRRAME